jgi:hypothetical protein
MPSRDDAVLITPLASTLGSHHRDQRDQKRKYDDGDDEAARYKERHSDSLHPRLRKPNTPRTPPSAEPLAVPKIHAPARGRPNARICLGNR